MRARQRDPSAGGALREELPMFERIIFAAAAVATIAGFLLEVGRMVIAKLHEDDEGRKRRGQR